MTKKLKPEFQPGGSKRHEILDKAVRYLQDPKMGLQSDRKYFLLEQVGLSVEEYLQALDRATGGELMSTSPAHSRDDCEVGDRRKRRAQDLLVELV